MNAQAHPGKLILASSSPYRRTLLERLGVPFTVHAPEVDELPRVDEGVAEVTRRLALAKAQQVADSCPDAFVVGSDQLAEFAGRSLGKPGSQEEAVAQLMQFSGRTVIFHTSAAVICRVSGYCRSATVATEVEFRALSDEEIRRYVALDRPFDCAGALRSEAGGPMLLRAQRSTDPTAIIGLPLIAVSGMLRDAGFRLP